MLQRVRRSVDPFGLTRDRNRGKLRFRRHQCTDPGHDTFQQAQDLAHLRQPSLPVRTVPRQQLRPRVEGVDIVQDQLALGQDRTVVQFECRYAPTGFTTSTSDSGE